ncbi:FtsW/RodA/SpoVE family cell cycle protein [Helicobacter brantae]|uniref:Probable peptidoglycan glycosyltransferase FtsW n=1 Tax=Helicobacter brantae TaxID=375927 RepID=A0A3D8IXT3_9HELI|nr:FtsW/RodA/SpoVE family cell cycle protein [Helicobacter brantae]RDU69361.1 cell division protein [Helicobacter brantae]
MQKKIFYSAVFLFAVGIVMSYSLSTYTILHFSYQDYHFLFRQFIAVIVGVLLMWGISQIDMDKYFKKLMPYFFLGSLIVIVALYWAPESMATSAGGAKRWLRLGAFSIAPLEFFKIGFVMFLAINLTKNFRLDKKVELKSEIVSLLPYLGLIVMCYGAIVVFQNDFGQVFVMSLILCMMLIFVGGSLRMMLVLLVGIMMLVLLAVGLSSRRIERIKIWMVGLRDMLPSGITQYLRLDELPEPYQLYHAGNAIWNGGFFGNGVGDGVVKLGFLSEAHTDMVLAGLAEEFGVVGIFVVLSVFVFGILFPILKIANRVENRTYSLYCIGIAFLLFFSFFVNAMGVAGLIPIKGIAVPFLSYGGSVTLATSIALGFVLAISKKIAS